MFQTIYIHGLSREILFVFSVFIYFKFEKKMPLFVCIYHKNVWSKQTNKNTQKKQQQKWNKIAIEIAWATGIGYKHFEVSRNLEADFISI